MIPKNLNSKIGYDSATLDVAFQLFQHGMVWDGDLASKSARDYLVQNGYAVRAEGYQALTGKGKVAFLTSPVVWRSAFRRWRHWKRNPFVARPA